MHPELQEFLDLIEDKKKSINELHAYQIIQTEIESDLGIRKLEFRYDDNLEIDLDLIEAEFTLFNSYLSELAGQIQASLTNIEYLSDKIANF